MTPETLGEAERDRRLALERLARAASDYVHDGIDRDHGALLEAVRRFDTADRAYDQAVDGFAAALEDARVEVDRLDLMARRGRVEQLHPIVRQLNQAVTAMAVCHEARGSLFTVVRVHLVTGDVVEVFAQGDDGPDEAQDWAADLLQVGLPIRGLRADSTHAEVVVPARSVLFVEALEVDG